MLFTSGLLGENARTVDVTKQFFSEIQQRDFEKASSYLTQDYLNAHSSIIEHEFAIESALLHYFNINISSNYLVKAKRNQLWLPYISNDEITVSLQLKKIEKVSFWKSLFRTTKDIYIEDFLTLKRDGGKWKIADIDLSNPEIQAEYSSIKTMVESDNFLNEQEGILSLKSRDIAIDELSLNERRIMIFKLKKTLAILSAGETNK